MKYCKNEGCENPARSSNRSLYCGRCTSIKSRYGITYEERTKLLESQDNRCACCKKPIQFDSDMSSSSACVDHSENPFKVRGILCNHCNRGIGLLGDDLEGVRAAVKYLENQ